MCVKTLPGFSGVALKSKKGLSVNPSPISEYPSLKRAILCFLLKSEKNLTPITS
jgi:hypothetical protein